MKTSTTAPPMTSAERQRKSRHARAAAGHVLIQFSASPKAVAAIEAECVKHGCGMTQALNRILERRRAPGGRK